MDENKVVVVTSLEQLKSMAASLKEDTQKEIAAQVAAAPHLTRKKVASLADIDPAAEGADKYIYMVPKTDAEDNNLYDEYMVLDGAVEHIGSTKVDLSGYQLKEEGKGLSTNDFTNEDKAKLDSLRVASDEEFQAMLNEVFGPKE